MKIGWRDGNLSTISLLIFFFVFLNVSVFPSDFFKIKENIANNSWKKIGFIYISPSILLKDIGYNSNIYYFDEEETPDWTADAGLKADFYALIGKRLIIEVKESPYYSFYLENKDLQYFNNDLKATVYSYLGRFNMKYSYGVSKVLSRPTVEFGNRIKTLRYSNGFSVDYGNYNKFFVGFNALTVDLRYDAKDYLGNYDIATIMNNKTTTFDFTLNIVIFTRTLLFFNSEFFDIKFGADTFRDGAGRIFSVGVKFPEVSIFKGEFRIGVKYFTPGDSAAEKYSKPNGSGNILFRLTKRFRLGLGYTIDNQYSYIQQDQYFDFKRYSVSLEYYLSRNIKIGYKFTSGESIYKNITGGESGRKDEIEQSDLKIGYRISGNMEFGIQYTDYTGRSNYSEFTRKFHFIGGYISHEF